MKDKWETFSRLEKSVDRELDSIHEEIRAHHSSWDNHIITLSMAAIGFSFTVIPLSEVCYKSLLICGLLCFVLSIAFALVNYIFADKNLKVALAGNMRRSTANIKVRHRLHDLEKELAELPVTQIELQEASKAKADKEIMEIYNTTRTDGDINETNRWNKIIRFLNHAKTYSFILGVGAVTFFCIANIDKFGA